MLTRRAAPLLPEVVPKIGVLCMCMWGELSMWRQAVLGLESGG